MKSRFIAALLAFFLGGLGIHKFYLGKWCGIFYLIFCWTYIPTIISFIEGILFLTNGEDNFNRKYNKEKHYASESLGQNIDHNTSFQYKICHSCGKENEMDSNFCERCGQKFNH